MPSLDALEDVVRREYDVQERRADALDTKAGLALGFAGLVVSLAPASVWAPLSVLARVLAGFAGVLALRVLAVDPRLAPRLDVLDERPLSEARRELVGTTIAAHGLLQAVVAKKTRRIRATLLLLTAAVGSMALGTAAQVVQEVVRRP